VAKVVFLDGEQIYLRPLERGDAATIQPWVNDQAVTRTLLLYRPLSRESEEEFIDRMNKSESGVVFGIVERGGDQLVGAAGLPEIDFRNRHASFGVFIGDRSKWGRGIGSEATYLVTKYAFETLNLNRVWLHVTTENVAGIRAYEKAGFRREGLLRQHLYREGRYFDIVSMAVLREEWFVAASAPPRPPRDAKRA
jgi:ribosomal-protein-alanine N-acetyltransferase